MDETIALDPIFARDVREGLTAATKEIPPRWLYDQRGSELFEEITRLPEYYLTRTEHAILKDHADTIVAACPSPLELAELGAGSAEKTELLIGAALGAQGPTTYCPIDISASALEAATERLTRRFPELTVRAVVGRYTDGLAKLRRTGGPARLVMFIGSSIGNFDREHQGWLMDQCAQAMRTEDRFLLGVDMMKDVGVLEAAYNDAQGVTAEFTTNLLARMNRELGADFDLERFEHRAWFDEDKGAVTIHVESLADQDVHLAALDLTVHFDEGELLHTEDSHKFTEARLDALVGHAGLGRVRSWYDEREWFGVHLLARTGQA